MLRSVDWYLFTDVSRQPVDTVLKGQSVQETLLTNYSLRCVTSQKSEGLIYTVAEDCNHAFLCAIFKLSFQDIRLFCIAQMLSLPLTFLVSNRS